MLHVLVALIILRMDALVEATAWSDIPLPQRSSFHGIDAPTDLMRWNAARQLAESGEQVLLKKVLETVNNPFDFIQGKISFKDIHKIGDIFISKATGGLSNMKSQYTYKRPPITLLGFRTFSHSKHEGKELKFDGFHPGNVLVVNSICSLMGPFLEALGAGKLPRKMIAIGKYMYYCL